MKTFLELESWGVKIVVDGNIVTAHTVTEWEPGEAAIDISDTPLGVALLTGMLVEDEPTCPCPICTMPMSQP